jgi:hypothetical protein
MNMVFVRRKAFSLAIAHTQEGETAGPTQSTSPTEALVPKPDLKLDELVSSAIPNVIKF